MRTKDLKPGDVVTLTDGFGKIRKRYASDGEVHYHIVTKRDSLTVIVVEVLSEDSVLFIDSCGSVEEFDSFTFSSNRVEWTRAG